MRRIMMAQCILLVLMICLPIGGEENIESFIQQVEQGLSPSVIIKGTTQWNLQERMAHHGVPGLGVAVIYNYKIHWAKGYGVADKNSAQFVNKSTLFQAASISKPVTALVALKLVQKGVLNLDSDVNRQLKSWKVPENKFSRDNKVTLRRLLSHSAGLTVSGFRGYGKGEKAPTILDVLDGKPPANSKPVRIFQEPGKGFRYSGGGYTVLQLLIEDVSGRVLPSLAQEYIFNPLGMKHSSFQKPLPESLAGLRSAPHSRQGESLPAHWFLKGGSGCCGLWTTPSDLARFAVEIQRIQRGEKERILSSRLGLAMLTPYNSPTMGLGFALTRINDAVYFQHSGGNPPGFSCLLFASRDKGHGVVIMANSYGGGPLCREIIQAVAAVYHWDGFKRQMYESVSQMVQTYREMRKKNPKERRISENNINNIGYTLLRNGNNKMALAVFKLNCEFYSQSANCYDSLGDGYLAMGDRSNALRAFAKVLKVLDQYPGQNKNHMRLRKVTGDKIKKIKAKKVKK